MALLPPLYGEAAKSGRRRLRKHQEEEGGEERRQTEDESVDEEETKHGASQTNAEGTEGQSVCVVSQDVCVVPFVCDGPNGVGWGGLCCQRQLKLRWGLTAANTPSPPPRTETHI